MKLKKPLAFASVLTRRPHKCFYSQTGPPFLIYILTSPKTEFTKKMKSVYSVFYRELQEHLYNEIIKIITGYGKVISGKLLVFNIQENRFDLFRF